MCKGYFNVLPFQMDNVIQTFRGHIVLQQIFQTMTRQNLLTIVEECQSGIQIRIVSEQRFHELALELVVYEQCIVRLEEDICSVFFGTVFSDIGDELTFLERSPTYLSVAIARHFEVATQSIHSLDTYPIQSHALLERFRVVLTPCIQLANRLNKFSLRDTTTIVAHTYPQVVLNGYLNLLSSAHLELIDAVIHHFFQEYIDTVIILLSIAQTTDVHPRTHTDMLHIVKVAYVVFVIFYGIDRLI